MLRVELALDDGHVGGGEHQDGAGKGDLNESERKTMRKLAETLSSGDNTGEVALLQVEPALREAGRIIEMDFGGKNKKRVRAEQNNRLEGQLVNIERCRMSKGHSMSLLAETRTRKGSREEESE